MYITICSTHIIINTQCTEIKPQRTQNTMHKPHHTIPNAKQAITNTLATRSYTPTRCTT